MRESYNFAVGIFAAYRSLSQSKLKETIGLEYTINGS